MFAAPPPSIARDHEATERRGWGCGPFGGRRVRRFEWAASSAVGPAHKRRARETAGVHGRGGRGGRVGAHRHAEVDNLVHWQSGPVKQRKRRLVNLSAPDGLPTPTHLRYPRAYLLLRVWWLEPTYPPWPVVGLRARRFSFRATRFSRGLFSRVPLQNKFWSCQKGGREASSAAHAATHLLKII